MEKRMEWDEIVRLLNAKQYADIRQFLSDINEADLAA